MQGLSKKPIESEKIAENLETQDLKPVEHPSAPEVVGEGEVAAPAETAITWAEPPAVSDSSEVGNINAIVRPDEERRMAEYQSIVLNDQGDEATINAAMQAVVEERLKQKSETKENG